LEHPTLAGDLRAAAGYFANWHFAAQSFDYMSSPDRSPVLHFWSLGVEEQFYILWPLLLLFVGGAAARRGDVARCRRRVVQALGGILVVSLALSMWQTPRSEPWAYYGLHTRAWELAAGGLLACVPLRAVQSTPRWMRGVTGWLGLAFVLVASTRFDATTTFPGIAAALPVAGAVMLVAAGLDGANVGTRRLLSAKPLRYVGRVSYSWYLWHWPALVVAGVLTAGAVTPDEGTGSTGLSVPTAMTAVAASFLLAVVTHHLVEDPVRRARSLAAVKARSLTLGASLTALSLGAVTLVLSAPATEASQSVTVDTVGRGASGTAAAKSRPTVVHLVESPQAASHDMPHRSGACYPLYDTETAPAPAACQFGDPTGTKTVVLLGDSHAQEWRDALAQQAKLYHWKVYMWTKSECPFNDVRIWLPRFHGEYVGCLQWRQKVLAQLRSLQHIDAVVVAHTSTYGVHVLDGHGHKVAPTAVGALWTAGWRSMAQRLTSLAAHVVVLKDVPKAGVNVPDCLTQHHADATSCSPKRADAYFMRGEFLAMEQAAAVERVAYVDLDPAICPGDPCPVVTDDGVIMYRDTNHLTASFTLRLAPRLGNNLRAIMAA
jgi:peptidoglycan/LPS O-acetylase OafA/YrhL